MLPVIDDLDREIEQAIGDVDRADERVGRAVTTLKRRWSDRMPLVAGVGVAGLVAAALLLIPRARRSPAAGVRATDWGRMANPLVNLLMSRAIGAITAFAAAFASRRPYKALATVPHVELSRFAGQWFEIARLPISSERGCDRDVTAHYEVTEEGLSVINRCRRASGRLKTAVGRGRVVDARSNARLQISFAPSLFDVLPFVWADYWILDLADDYSAALVGTPNRRHLWLLSRTPSLPGTALSTFVTRAEQQGYDTTRLMYTEHTIRHAPPAPAATGEPTAPVTEGRPAEPAAERVDATV